MRPGTKKWVAHSGELFLFLVFAGCGILASDDLKGLKQSGLPGLRSAPVIVWLWFGVGLSFTVCRIYASRYARAEALNVLSAPAFVEAYRKLVGDSIDTLASIMRDPEPRHEILQSAEGAMLNAIEKTVDYYRSATARRQTSVNCLLMEPRPYDPVADAETSILGLEPGGREHLEYLLRIVRMSQEQLEIPAALLLPVYRVNGPFRDKNALGAPRAFVTRRNQLISFTLWLFPHLGHSSNSVKRELWRYFWERKGAFLSFASLPIICDKTTVAVITVHCRWFRVLGKNPSMLIDFLIPFLTVLSYIYDRKETRG